MTPHDVLAFGIGAFSTASLWAWFQLLTERKRNRLASCAIGQLIAERDKAAVIICQLRDTVFHQQETIEKFGHEVEPGDDFKITGDN